MTDLTHLKEIAVSDTGFVFDPYSGGTFTVNETGLRILRALKDGADKAAILAALRDDFDVREGDPERDLDEFVALLRQYGLVAKDFSP